MKLLMAIALSLFLIGCSTTGEVKEVLVPVSSPIAEPPVIEEPYLPIWLLSDEDDANPDKVARYYVKALAMQRIYAAKLQCALDAYRIKTEKQCPINTEEK